MPTSDDDLCVIVRRVMTGELDLFSFTDAIRGLPHAELVRLGDMLREGMHTVEHTQEEEGSI
jgi:hypothetical protein